MRNSPLRAPGRDRPRLDRRSRRASPAQERRDGITRTEVRDLFSRNKKAREIDLALAALVDAGRLDRREQRDGAGRPAEIWIPTRNAA